MRNINAALIFLSATLFVSCKKEYSCECFNPRGVFKTYSIRDTEENALLKCENYSKEYQSIPFSETACELK